MHDRSHPAPHSPASDGHAAESGERPPAGFTLIEVLVVIVVVSVLVGLVVMGLSRTRRSSTEALMLSRLAQHAAVFHAYANDYRDRSPYFSDPAQEVNRFVCEGDGESMSGNYWSPAFYWHIAMGDAYYNGRSSGPEFYNPVNDPAIGGLFMYQPVMFSGPDYWDPTKRVKNDPLQYTACGLADVSFPTQKAWIVTEYMGLSPGQGPYFSTGHWSGMAFIDGHAKHVSAAEQGPVYPQAELVPPFGNFAPLYTLYGVRGRDVRQ